MATAQTVAFSDVEPAEGRKFLSKHRNVQLPLHTFEDRENPSEFVPFTPIQQALRDNHNQSTETLGPQRVVKFRIYLTRVENNAVPENGVELNIESGKTANSKTLLYLLAKEYEIDVDAFEEMFAIWMISPLLEVQLKPYHRPYECRHGWKTLLERFADDVSPQMIVQDEPILMLRRNASLTSERQFELLDHYPQCARFLIIDAREMLLLGRLQFLSLEDTILVAALLFCLQYGNHQERVHDVVFIRSHLEEILPERTCESIAAKTFFGKSINKKTPQEERLLNSWKSCTELGSEAEKEHKLLLTLTQNSSCYGAAWFSARIEKKTSRVSVRNFGQGFAEIKVNIGINDRWLTIVDADSSETLLVQSIEEMSWQLEASKEEETPFLILNLSCEESNVTNGNGVSIEINSGQETAFFLMVIGNQTPLIDALLKTLTGRRLERTISDSSSSDSSTSSARHASLIQSKVELKDCSAMNNRKLCLAKFENGKCTEVAGSFKSFYCHGQTL
ncbi:unnamed protein product [Caenorhabditis sp. 36 PRJEB53466]|nr:unnamed protein product [Caenorhabditis sp. 36 PRJEB53466]